MAAYDLIVVGGGLHGGLTALAVAQRSSEAKVAVVEREPHFGGNHTWCFYEGDVPPDAMSWFEPLVAHRWPRYSLRFPGLERTFPAAYHAVTSDGFHEVLDRVLGAAPAFDLFTGREAVEILPEAVILDGGERLEAEWVLDVRGPRLPPEGAPTGYQKFVGLEVELAAPHGLDHPLVMDATLDQRDEGFRFMYLLPFGPRRLLAEETFFNRARPLPYQRIRSSVLEYLERRGWEVENVVREESGNLPMPWGHVPLPGSSASPLVAGYGGGFFNPGTGYSLPVAVRFAELVAQRWPRPPFGAELEAFRRRHAAQARFYQRLNFMLFRGTRPRDRWRLLERFYRLPDGLVSRFYSMELTPADYATILFRSPPKGLSLRALLGLTSPE